MNNQISNEHIKTANKNVTYVYLVVSSNHDVVCAFFDKIEAEQIADTMNKESIDTAYCVESVLIQ